MSPLPAALSPFLHSPLSSYPIAVVGTTCQPQSMSPTVRSLFLNEVALDTPNEKERLDMLQALAATVPTAKHVDMSEVAKKTAVSVVRVCCVRE